MDFVYINYNILDNLFYILVSILIYFVLIDHVKVFKQYTKTILTFCMSVPIILCMKFPIYIDEYCVHDLRSIPFILATLYGGWPVGLAMLIILLAARFAIYGFNLLTLIVYIVIFLATALCSPSFNKFNRRDQLTFAFFLTLFLGIVSTVLAVTMSDFFKVTQAYVFYFIILPPIVVVMSIYIFGFLKDSLSIRSQIVKLEKMEVVSQLAASISHEVRNPLTVVKGYVHLLKQPTLSLEEKDQYLVHVDRELKSAEKIISEYLAFAKPATEQIEDISVDYEIKNVIEIIKPLANINSIRITEEITPGTTRGNVQHFKQCLLNLFKNSIEAMPYGGELGIISFKEGNNLIIKIIDSGIGMTQEQVYRFGEPYYSSKEKGTGLGSMVIVRTIETMNGKLKIKSTPQVGTTMIIKLPLY
ncbi:two-component system sporulation sensor kinase B [Bacillus mesophilus]|uniref:histidine kinase n=1 Tax=Bacillus mesophilus TaxID=1808955 RepID=A0A6M0QBF1_9BACI|nr:HAMP domain-containing sensor histidine kinase [Bacillus mesophilus]MBM7662537.1 two-component system sporulation sensor kinase B [Bacillus mesophilus]NEY72840.1 HAMP domain-containing histidine kinase [Bacillus mesophilus]